MLVRSDMKQPRDPARASVGAVKAAETTDLGRGPRPSGAVAAREWDVAHAAALRALMTQPRAGLPNQVGDPQLATCVREARRPPLLPADSPVPRALDLLPYERQPWPKA